MDCTTARQILDCAFDGMEQGEQLALADTHADHCPACGAYRRELRAYTALMGDLSEVEIPEGLEERLLVAVEGAKPRPRSPLLPVTFLAFVAFGAVLGTQIVSTQARVQAREAREAQQHRETISRSVARDRAIFAADPVGGSPVIAFTGYAGK